MLVLFLYLLVQMILLVKHCILYKTLEVVTLLLFWEIYFFFFFFFMSSLYLTRKSFWSIPVYFSGLFSILFSIFLLSLCILRNLAVIDFITCASFCTEIIQTSQLARNAHREILIMIVFRIPLFQKMLLKILWLQNCCYSPLNFFLKDWLVADGCSRLFTLHSSSTLKSIQIDTNRISNMLNSTAAHFELYETCMPERFCENNEQLKKVIYFVKDLHYRSSTGL